MTPNEVYTLPVESIDKGHSALFGSYYSHVEGLEQHDTNYDLADEDERVKILNFKEHSFDGRRIWKMAGVQFDGSWVMIIQNAGREGDDYVGTFITDAEAYEEMREYLIKLHGNENPEFRVVAMDQDHPELGNFYGHTLDSEFETY